MPGKTEVLSELEKRQHQNRDANLKELQKLGLLKPICQKRPAPPARPRPAKKALLPTRRSTRRIIKKRPFPVAQPQLAKKARPSRKNGPYGTELIEGRRRSMRTIKVGCGRKRDAARPFSRPTPQTRAPSKMPRAEADKPRGCRSAYAYFVQTSRDELREKRPKPKEAFFFVGFSQKCSDRWKVISDEEKKRFVAMADRDKTRFEAEMKHYVPPPGGKTNSGRRKKPNAPKRCLSAFYWFCNGERLAIRDANPGYTVGDMAKALGRKWVELDETSKKRYLAMAEKDSERYAKEMVAYMGGGCPAPADRNAGESECLKGKELPVLLCAENLVV